MKLYVSPTSPFARKVRMAVLERGLAEAVEQVFVNPFDNPPELVAANPLGKVPVLVQPDGTALFDSTVICAFLDTLGTAPRLIPEPPLAWPVLTGHALANGMLDAMFSIVIERRRPEAERSLHWQNLWQAAVLRAADVLEADASLLAGDLSLAQITIGAALGYADFRLPDIGWRTKRPNLAGWFTAFAVRPSMVATVPIG
jgi:glutathione S-transferase